MRAVVVYESMYGNTHLVADAIGAGLRTGYDVRVVPVSQLSEAVLADADLVVVGGPTVEPDALGPGLREWFCSLDHHPVKAAAFDTRRLGPAVLTGRASRGVDRQLRAHGFDVVAEPESFLVTKQDRLELHQTARAMEWGSRLAARLAASSAGATRSQ